MSSDALARAIGVRRQRISGIENCHVRPDDGELHAILDFFQVVPARRAAILSAAVDARQVGWWEKIAAEIGPRQALYANLESGASVVCEYQFAFLPGLLQIPAFTAALARPDQALYPDGFNPERAIEARTARQAVLLRPDAPHYHVLIDELAIRRPAADVDVVHDQLQHLAVLMQEHPGITIQVLPLQARISGWLAPRSAFSIYRYPDPEDPVVVAVDTVTSDMLLTAPEQVSHYERLHDYLSQIALSRSDSFDLVVTVAEDLDTTRVT